MSFDKSFWLSRFQRFQSDSLGGPFEVIHRLLILDFRLRNMNYPTARLLELPHRLPPPDLLPHHESCHPYQSCQINQAEGERNAEDAWGLALFLQKVSGQRHGVEGGLQRHGQLIQKMARPSGFRIEIVRIARVQMMQNRMKIPSRGL